MRANSLIATGTELGIGNFLLVQWVASLASEAPEFIVAIVFAVHGKRADAIDTLIPARSTSGRCWWAAQPAARVPANGTAPTLAQATTPAQPA